MDGEGSRRSGSYRGRRRRRRVVFEKRGGGGGAVRRAILGVVRQGDVAVRRERRAGRGCFECTRRRGRGSFVSFLRERRGGADRGRRRRQRGIPTAVEGVAEKGASRSGGVDATIPATFRNRRWRFRRSERRVSSAVLASKGRAADGDVSDQTAETRRRPSLDERRCRGSHRGRGVVASVGLPRHACLFLPLSRGCSSSPPIHFRIDAPKDESRTVQFHENAPRHDGHSVLPREKEAGPVIGRGRLRFGRLGGDGGYRGATLERGRE
mmetsp:Transcript_3718/g.7343  ORF Transcript_3718/g.7343 Transcript_3718/m.7343 type:complete len:267 (+) Transcript_3718:410-1210(+)